MSAPLDDKLAVLQVTIEKVGRNTEILKAAIKEFQTVLEAHNRILQHLEARVLQLEHIEEAVNVVNRTVRES